MKFTELNLKPKLLEAISYMGFENATEIQASAIPKILEGKDVIACAQTGTGKTGAFLIPILHKLIGREELDTNTLIIVPTRELAVQIEQQIQGLSYFISVTSIAIYGGGSGMDWVQEKKALTQGADIIVATPGKLLSHLKMGYVKFNKVEHMILDEADRMLDMGFIDDIQKIGSYLPKQRQNLLFSATMPNSIQDLSKQLLDNPYKIMLSISKPAAGVKQRAILCYPAQKNEIVKEIIRSKPEYDSIIIFSSTKDGVKSLSQELRRDKFNVKAVSSDLNQEQREEALRGFRSKRIRIVVATDVLSRGIDIKDINLVINYDVPRDAEDYVHRVGRTARAKTKGEAITLIQPKEMYDFSLIEELIEQSLEKENPLGDIGKGPEWRPERPKKQKGKHNHSKGNHKKKPFKKGKKVFKKRNHFSKGNIQ
jgi:superfamily II DNA/RNA helicase